MLELLLTAVAGPPAPGAQMRAEARAHAERVAMAAADQRCGLLGPRDRSRLAAGVLQARGALLRAGLAETEVEAQAGEARRAIAARACNDPVLRAEAARLRDSFAALDGVSQMDFSGWTARRWGADAWRIVHDAPGGQRAGLIETAGAFALAVETPNAAPARAARLVLRDPARARASELIALTARGPSPALTRTIWASEARAAESRPRIKAPPRAGLLFVFPREAAVAIAALDPREPVWFEIERAGGVERVRVPVADFAAARAFLAP